MQHRISTADQLGLLLQAARKAGHFTQARLAAQMGLSQSRLSKIEQNPGSATVQQLLALCSVLGIELLMQSSVRAASSPSAPTDGSAFAGEW
jgi:HTH-type transcriptional regulator/antitoxin HipB